MSTSTSTPPSPRPRDVVGILQTVMDKHKAQSKTCASTADGARAHACHPTSRPVSPSPTSTSTTTTDLNKALDEYDELLASLSGSKLATAKRQSLQDGFHKLRGLIEEVCTHAVSRIHSAQALPLAPSDQATQLATLSLQLKDIQATLSALGNNPRTPYSQAARAGLQDKNKEQPQLAEPRQPHTRLTTHEVTITAKEPETKEQWKKATEASIKSRIDAALAAASSASPTLSMPSIHGVRKKRNGELILVARSEQQAETLLTHAQHWLGSFDEGASIKAMYYQVSVNGVPTSFDPTSPTARESLTQDNNLAHPDVITNIRWMGHKRSDSVAKAESSLLLTLSSAKIADHLIYTGMSVRGKMCDVRKHIPPPPQCYRCQAFGHQAKACPTSKQTDTVRCARCAGTHATRDCKCPHSTPCTNLRTCLHITPKCANCNGNHKALSAQCPTKQKALAAAAAKFGPPSLFFDPQYSPCAKTQGLSK